MLYFLKMDCLLSVFLPRENAMKIIEDDIAHIAIWI